MQKPNLNKIIADNLDKAKFQSKSQPSLPTDGWLNEYSNGGIYLSDKAKATQFGQYKRGGGYFPEYHSYAPPRMDVGGNACYDNKGNVIPCDQQRLQELGLDAYTAMQPFYNTIYEAANKYANPETGLVSRFNNFRAGMKGLIKHPEVMFMKRHPLPNQAKDPYHTGSYQVDDIGNIKTTYQPSQWAEPRKEHHGLGDWIERIRMQHQENKAERQGRRDRGRTGCWGANCVENEMQDEAKYGGGLLSRTVTCSNCGWSWKATDGGSDPMTCHKCGGTIKMSNGGDISIPDLQEGNWLNRYDEGGPGPKTFFSNESTSLGTPRRDAEILDQLAKRKEFEKYITNQPQLKQATKSTPVQEKERIRKNKEYASSLPNAQVNSQGNVSRVNPNRSVTGEAENFMSRREDKASEHALGALEAAGYITGAGELAGAGYKALKPMIAESMESGLLSNTYKINPWAFKANPEAYYRMLGKEGTADAFESGIIRAKQNNNLMSLDPDKGFDFTPKQGPLYDRPYFSKGTPFDRDWKSPLSKKKGSIYPGPNMVEVSNASKFDLTNDLVKSPNQTLKSFDPDTKFYKQDWLKGYKEVPKPKTIEDLVDLYRIQEKGFDLNSNTIAQMEKAAAEGTLSPVQKMMLNNPYDRQRLMARDKFWGQWFEKDPKRLEYYINDKGPDSEILHVRVPRSEAPNHSIKNFESQESLVPGAPLEYHERMSLSPETEFILPKNIIQSAKKYPVSEWQRLIKEHKPWMGILPLAGTAALNQKENGGWLTQYADEGLQVTTETTKPPVFTEDPRKVQAYNDSLALYNDYNRVKNILDKQYNSSDYIKEQEDFPRNPDGSICYNCIKKEAERKKQVGNFINNLYGKVQQLANPNINPKGYINYIKDNLLFDESQGKIYNYSNVEPVQPYILQQKYKPSEWKPLTPKIAKGHFSGDISNMVYRETGDPDHPYDITGAPPKTKKQKRVETEFGFPGFEEEDNQPTLHPTVMNVQPIHSQNKMLQLYSNMIPRSTPNVTLPSKIDMGNYKVDYFDPTEGTEHNGGWHTKSFMTEGESENYMKNRPFYGPNMTQRVEYKNGGWLQKYPGGGLFGLPSMVNLLPSSPIMKWATHKPTVGDAAANLVDPTGLSNVPFVNESMREMIQHPSWGNALTLGFDIAGSVPVFGETVRPIAQARREANLATKVGRGAGKVMKTVTNVVEAPAKLVNKAYSKLGVVAPVLNNSIGLWNRGVHGYQAATEGVRQGLNYISPGTQQQNVQTPYAPQQKYGGTWLNKYK